MRSPDTAARNFSLALAAGLLGALANQIALWALGLAGVIPAQQIAFPVPEPLRLWLYTALVWGALWGLLFLLPWRGSGGCAASCSASVRPWASGW
jgi:hypothetical protein